MIVHVLGRPSTQLRRLQIFAVLSICSLYLYNGNKHGPPGIRKFSASLAGSLTPWQTMFMTMIGLYISKNFTRILGLDGPEPLANIYSPSFFRATWILTALDAGFWTAMNIRPKWLRDIASLIFSVYYLFAVDRANEKVQKVHSNLTVEHVRVAWNKGKTPYLSALSSLGRPKFTKYPPRAIRIPRPEQSSYTEPVNAWIYFDGPLEALRSQKSVVLDIPGGGFVAMDPRTVDDKLLAWAGKLGVPVISLDYRKAPEYPYPYAINECYDVYHMIITTRGQCLGLSGDIQPQIVVTGDSAGGNLAAGLTLMTLQSGDNGRQTIPRPDGLILIYPALSGKWGTWIESEQMALIQDKSVCKTNKNLIQLKREYYESFGSSAAPLRQGEVGTNSSKELESQPDQVSTTHVPVSSMTSYFNDRVLAPDMARSMVMLYLGPHTRDTDFSTDFVLSPIVAPESLLARFPKTYLITGEKDPLVDDTVIFAGRLRQAKLRKQQGLEKTDAGFNDKEHLEVTLIPGVSHGFLQFAGFFPDAWKYIDCCARWAQDLFQKADLEN